MHDFKVGDKVICVDDYGAFLFKGKVYIVKYIEEDRVSVDEAVFYNAYRFVKLTPMQEILYS